MKELVHSSIESSYKLRSITFLLRTLKFMLALMNAQVLIFHPFILHKAKFFIPRLVFSYIFENDPFLTVSLKRSMHLFNMRMSYIARKVIG